MDSQGSFPTDRPMHLIFSDPPFGRKERFEASSLLPRDGPPHQQTGWNEESECPQRRAIGWSTASDWCFWLGLWPKGKMSSLAPAAGACLFAEKAKALPRHMWSRNCDMNQVPRTEKEACQKLRIGVYMGGWPSWPLEPFWITTWQLGLPLINPEQNGGKEEHDLRSRILKI